MRKNSNAENHNPERSAAPRITLTQKAQLVEPSGAVIDVVVTDISKDGFHLEAFVPLPVADHLNLRIARYGDFPVQIRWARDHAAGGIFLGRSPELA